MRKSYKLCMAFLAIIAMSLYLAYIDLPVFSSLSEYLNQHLDNPQQYLFIVSIYVILVLWAIYVPYLEPCFYLRYTNVIEQINKRNVIYSLIFGIATFFIYVITAIAVGYSIDLNLNYLLIILKLILFYFMCFELSTAIYLLIKKAIPSILSLLIINLLIIAVYYAVYFYVFFNTISDGVYHMLFNVYIISVTITCLLFNEIYIKRKELV